MEVECLFATTRAQMGSLQMEILNNTFVLLVIQHVQHVRMMEILETKISVPHATMAGNCMPQSKNAWKLAELATMRLTKKLVISALSHAWIVLGINIIAKNVTLVAQTQLSSLPL
jgi:hypothetical protein